MNRSIITLLVGALPVAIFAQVEIPDSISCQELDGVVVEATLQQTSAQVSTYIPTMRQKTSAQSGEELLSRMAIPQLKIPDGNGGVETSGGKPVALYIDFLPASGQDLRGMRMSDVKKVEYYDYPTDPRFGGNPHVVNFIMAKYEYGGYVKLYGDENFIANSGQYQANAKLQYKSMTYDVVAGAYYSASDHDGMKRHEVFRLPQPDGSVKVFDRYSTLGDSKMRRHNWFGTFKTAYRSDRLTVNNVFSCDFDMKPHNDQRGSVSYLPSDFPVSAYTDNVDNSVRSATYSGYYFFSLPAGNSITLNPYYSYSHTAQNSAYKEGNGTPILNGARDNTNQLKLDLRFTHSFGKGGTLTAFCRGNYLSNRTRYSGSATAYDKSTSARFGAGSTYSISAGDFYGLVGFGWDWDRLKFGQTRDNSSAPWADLSLQYSINPKSSLSTEFHYSTWAPSSSYKSSSVIKASPLMSYTGNPALVPHKSYDVGASYVFIPSNRFNLSVHGSAWIVRDRYVYDYEACPSGILRTIRQPMGSYAQGQYGLYGSARLLDRKLQLSASVTHYLVHNGAPYGWTRSFVSYSLQALYYLGDFYFGANYVSKNGYADGCMVGTWMKTRDFYFAQVGWSTPSWNLRVLLRNFARWDWRGNSSVMESKYYDCYQTQYAAGDHAFIKLAATYTFGFGKKIERTDEANRVRGVSSGILK